jgi:hypothetical protein
MRHPRRSQLAAPVVVVYWLMVLGGLALFSSARADDVATVAPLWVGAIGGTLLGQYLALHDLRLWVAALIIALAGLYCGPLVPGGHFSAQLWQAFIPAALCGFWSLGDRAVLAAAWFPAVLWMLAILDRNDQQLAPDGVAAVLLGGLALLFVWFLRVRESRRVGLWRTVSPEPLAPIQPAELLREPPGRQLARAGWGLTVGALTVALAVWLAPPLWRTEMLGGDEVKLAGEPIDESIDGLPCCPLNRTAETESARIKEYLDLGLGHGEHITSLHDGIDCRACAEPVVVTAPMVSVNADAVGDEIAAPIADTEYDGVVSAAGEQGDTVQPVPAPTAEPIIARHTPSTATELPPLVPTAVVPPTEIPAAPEPPLIPAPVARPDPPPPDPAAAPANRQRPGVTARPTTPRHAASDTIGASLLPWVTLAAIMALLLQLVRFVLRPLRRLITLRHLRRPFWEETVDQRVSNSWQLALIGLRDAGWRAGVTEAPHELARRVGVEGLERCAAVLERARHGVGLDADDLGEMHAAADVAYRAARSGISGLARAIGWLRWPLT